MDKVLIIDDSAFDRKMIRKALLANSREIQITETENGRSVLEIMSEEKPNVTILDVRMPGLDGFEVLSMIRSNPDLEDHPVLMVSGSNDEKDQELARKHGANGYFVKPPDISAYFALGRNIYDQYLCCQSGHN